MKEIERHEEPTIQLTPIASEQPQKSKAALDLQLKMVTSSVNHEYARREYDECSDRAIQEELLDYMTECRDEYFKAREELVLIDPYAALEFERDLSKQKARMAEGFDA